MKAARDADVVVEDQPRSWQGVTWLSLNIYVGF